MFFLKIRINPIDDILVFMVNTKISDFLIYTLTNYFF